MKTFLRLIAAAFLLIGAMGAQAAVDLVGDDTDLFTTNPNIPSQVPSVLIVLDNTSNWSRASQHWPGADPACTAIGITGDQQGDAEVCGIYRALDKVDEQVNIGMMMFNDQDKGAYVRFPMSQMNATNKAAFKTKLVAISTNNPADKTSSNGTYGSPMNDVFRYLNSFVTFGGSGAAASPADAGGYTSTAKTTFNFPTDLNDNACGYAYVVFFGNGFPNADTITPNIDSAAALLNDTSVVVDKTVLQTSGANADIWSRFLFQYGIKVKDGVYRHVTTYTIDVCYRDCEANQATLLTSMATVSQGKYFKATSLSEIETALSTIFAEVQAVNSVFAATTLPVSINVRGTNLNQVYIGVFRPDPALSTRWLGNLKQYKLGVVNTTTGQLGLVDANNTNAVNLNTGFISNTATSIWTETVTPTGSGFWAFRNTYPQTDVGKDQDSPDGDLVEKGGAAQKIRQFYSSPDSVAAQTRNIYTCTACTASDTNGTCTAACVAGKQLSKYKFNVANGDVTAQLLGAFAAQSVTLLTGSTSTATATSANHGFTVGASIVVNGATPSLYNGTFTVATVPDVNTFTYSVSPSTIDSTHAYVTYPGYKLVPGTDTVTVSATPSTYNVTDAAISAVSGNINQFSYTLPGTTYPTTAASSYTVTANRRVTSLVYSAGTGKVTATVPSHGYTVAGALTSAVIISGAVETPGFNGSYSVIGDITTNSFTYTPVSPPSGGTVTTAQVTTATPVGFSWQTGNKIIVCSGGPTSASAYPAICTTASGFNQTGGATVSPVVAAGQTITVVTADTSGNTFSYAFGASPTTPAGGTTGGTGFTATRVFTNDTNTYNVANRPFTDATTSPPINTTAHTITLQVNGLVQGQTGQLAHTLAVGDSVTVSGVTCKKNNSSNACTPTSAAGDASFAATITAVGTASGNTTVTFAAHSQANKVTASSSAQVVWSGTTFSLPVNIGAYYADNTKTGPVADSPTVTATGTITSKRVGDLATTPNGSADVVTSITSQAIATGTITAALASSADPNERQNLINWVRGQDNKDNENLNGISTDIRASVHGDVLHSRPAVINYNRNSTTTVTDDNDVYIFYGANDGMLHAIKGGSLATGGGKEAWTFIPTDFFGKLKRMRDQSPSISSSNPKSYFYDGPIGVYTLDASPANNKLQPADNDKVYMYVGMRRGGRMYYAFDVTDPTDPVLLWKKGCPNATGTTGCDPGWSEVGQTWSQPQLGYLRNWPDKLVMIVAAGYDQPAEDLQPCFVTDWYYKASAGASPQVKAKTNVVVPTPMDATKCKAVVADSTLSTVTKDRTMGRGIFIVDASNGTILYRIGPSVDPSTEFGTLVPEMEFSMPGDLAVLRNRDNAGGRATVIGTESVPAGYLDRIYATDTGGNVWRVDVSAVSSDPAVAPAYVVSRLASLASTTYTTGGHPAQNYRKFFFNPDVVYTTESDGSKYDAVLVGSGDREHPFDMTVNNRFYMIKDKNTGSLVSADVDTTSTDLKVKWAAPTVAIVTDTRPSVGIATDSATAVDLFDVTNNCLQSASNCDTASGQTQAVASAALKAAKGWKLLFPNTGEKTVATATTAAGTVIFNTNQPKQDTVSGSDDSSSNFCTSDLGTARQYGINYLDATSKNIFSSLPTQYVESGGRDAMFAGGGFLPTPVPVVVQIDGKYYQTVIAGVQTTNPGGLKFQSRLRTYWYRKTD